MKKLFYIFTLIAVAFMFYNCDGTPFEPPYDPPGQITNVTFTPNNGGGYFLYTIPPDETFLYVRAEYTIDSGQRIIKTSSVHSDTLFISGLGSVKEYEVRLYSVNRVGQRSAPVIKRVTPLEPHTQAVLRTIDVMPGFSSLVVNWDNELGLPLNVFVTVTIQGNDITLVGTSNMVRGHFMIPSLEAIPHPVRVRLEDMYGNETATMDFGTHTPLFDAPITKRYWSFLRDAYLFGPSRWDFSNPDPFQQTPLPAYMYIWRGDSMRNAPEFHVEGRIQHFWDNVYDYAPALNANFFHTGPAGYPFSYFIDMGREIVISRFKIWQRDWGGQLFGGENVRVFELWISNDQSGDGVLDDWELLGRYTIERHPDPLRARFEARNGHEFLIYPDNPRFTRPFRFLRFKGIEQWGNPDHGLSGCMSEITLWGTEADGSIIYDPETLTGYIPGWES